MAARGGARPSQPAQAVTSRPSAAGGAAAGTAALRAGCPAGSAPWPALAGRPGKQGARERQRHAIDTDATSDATWKTVGPSMPTVCGSGQSRLPAARQGQAAPSRPLRRSRRRAGARTPSAAPPRATPAPSRCRAAAGTPAASGVGGMQWARTAGQLGMESLQPSGSRQSPIVTPHPPTSASTEDPPTHLDSHLCALQARQVDDPMRPLPKLHQHPILVRHKLCSVGGVGG